MMGRKSICVVVGGLLGLSTVGVATQLGTEPAAADVAPGCVVDTTGVLGWWRGEDDLLAEVGPDLTGTVAFDTGLVARGMALDGTNTISVDGLPPVSTAVTVELWVKPTNTGFTGLTQTLVSRWDFPSADDSARSFALLLDPYANLLWMTDETSTRRPEELRVAVPQIYDGAFHHVAATWDGTQFGIYFDGLLIASAPSQGGPLNPAATTPFRVGSTAGLGDPFRFTGILDEPSVWERVLDASEIGAIYASGAGGKCTFVPVQKAKLNATGGALLDQFGYSVGTHGTTIVVGAPLSSAATQFAGAAYVFTRAGAVWSLQAMLYASDRRPSDQLGHSVAVDGDTIVVGSYGNDNGGPSGTNSGAAYVFTRTGTTWTQQAKLTAAEAAAGDGFGYSVAIDGETIVVGTPLDDDAGGDSGSAYVFIRSGTTWSEQAKVVATDAAASDNFGLSVAVGADTIVVGSPSDDDAGSQSGSAYVFSRSGTVWSEQAKVTAADAAATDLFGNAVGIDGETMVVGSPLDDDAGADSGSAYVFTRSGTVWSPQAKVTAGDAAAGDRFGYSLGIDGATLAVGAYNDDDAGGDSGSAYVFTRSGTTWNELTKLLASDGAAGDYFGRSVAVSGSIVVGAYLDDDAGTSSGSAYVFAP